MILERNETRIARNENRLAGNENCLARNETRIARNETRGGNLHLSGTVKTLALEFCVLLFSVEIVWVVSFFLLAALELSFNSICLKLGESAFKL